MDLRLLALFSCAAGAYAFEDTTALVQGGLRIHQTAAETFETQTVTLQGGDLGMNMKPASGYELPPVPLTQAASDFMIPALGGSSSLTQETVGFKLWKVDDGKLRTFKSADNEGFYMFGTKSVQDTMRGRTVLYNATSNKKLAEIWMDSKDAAVRNIPLPGGIGTETRDRLLSVTYFVNAYKPLCVEQGSIGEDHATGDPLYAFAKVTKAAGKDRWTVKRLTCSGGDNNDGKFGSTWREAYTLDHHGMQTAMDAVAPNFGVVGTSDAMLKGVHADDSTEAAEEGAYQRRTSAWLAAGEDPALFAAALMITQMPGNPKPPAAKVSLLQREVICEDFTTEADCVPNAVCVWSSNACADPGRGSE